MKKVFFTLMLIFTACLSHAQILYATTETGGNANAGTICKLDLATNTLTAAFSFNSTNGRGPQGSLLQASDGKLYGMTQLGGSIDGGVIFSYDPATATYTKLKDFDGTNGRYPWGSLTQASDGKLYGITQQGGSSSGGVIFSYDPSTATYTKLKDFDYINGINPYGSLMRASDGKLYGMTQQGGSGGYGVIFSYDPATATYAKLRDFDFTNGAYPEGSLAQASNGKLYGMTVRGGSSSVGVIFSYDPVTAAYTKLLDFITGSNGNTPRGSLMPASNGKLYGMTQNGGSSSVGVIFSYDPSTATYTKLQDFNGTNGSSPHSSFVQASNGKLYGMTWLGGSGNVGVSFSLDPLTGNYTKLADFTGINGGNPGFNSFIEVCISTTWYRDADGDGFGDLNNSKTACSFPTPTGYVADHSDCDDTKFLYADNDGDGFGTGSPVACGVANNTDCNDNDANVHSPITYYKDNDHDGFGDLSNTTIACSSTPPPGYVANSTDCDDTKLLYADNDGDGFGAGSPVACGLANNTDCNDNNAVVHSPITYYKDNDGDGFGDLGNTTTACSLTPPAGYVADSTDCNDNDANVHSPITYYKDDDRDGFGDLNNKITLCSSTPPCGYVTNSTDCDDTKLLYADNDGDGFGTGSPVACGVVANNTDCNDYDASVHSPVTYYKDNDHDGYGDPNNTTLACSLTRPAGYVANSRDCDDNDAAVHPGAAEICGNGIDDNCNGKIDEGCSPVLITISGKAVTEGTKPKNFAVNLSKSSTKTITVDYTTQDISAMAGSDYTAQSGTLTFEPGIKQKVITIQLINDRLPEPDETFEILLSNPVNADITDGTGIVTILDDDGASKPGVQHQDAGSTVLKDFKLSPNPANGKVNIMLTGYSGNVTIQLTDINGKMLQERKVTGLSKLSQQQLNISHYPNGVYLVTVIDEKGNRKTEKLIIAR